MDSRFAELVEELKRAIKEHDDAHSDMDPTHAMHHIQQLHEIARLLIWLNAQTLMELARRDAEAPAPPSEQE